MADDNILPLVLIGGGVYLLYRWLAPSAAAAPAATTTGAAAPAGPAGPALAVEGSAAAAPASPGGAYNSLDQIYQRFQGSIQQNASADPAISFNQGFYQATPYVFNSYLARAGGFDLSSQISTLFPNGTDQKPVSLAQFWSVAAAWLAQNKGLSGLGFYGTFFSKMRHA